MSAEPELKQVWTAVADEVLTVLYAAQDRRNATVDELVDGGLLGVCAYLVPLKAPESSWGDVKRILLGKLDSVFDRALASHLLGEDEKAAGKEGV